MGTRAFIANHTTSPGTTWAWAWEDYGYFELDLVHAEVSRVEPETWYPSRLIGTYEGPEAWFYHVPTVWGSEHIPWRGSRFWFGITGVVRDVYGSPVPGAVVKLFRTADDTLISTAVADANGFYVLITPHTDGHYVYARGTVSGIPVQGVTVNTLVGV